MQEKNKEILLPLSLFSLTVITRIPFASKLLYHIDSGNFALALEKYDISVHQPHPPGYFLYVMLGRLLHLFVMDANTVFVSISIIFSGLAVAAIYFLGKELYDRKIGFIAAALAVTSPNLWFHGEVALSYIVEAFFSTLTALLCWRIYRGEHKHIWLSVLILGIAGGIRQNSIAFLLPLWLFSVKGVPVRKIAAYLGLLIFVCLLWFIPMIRITGGWTVYSKALQDLWLFNSGHASVFERGWPSFKIFSSSLFDFTIYGVGAGSLILGLALYSLLRNGNIKSLDRKMVFFFSAWMLPSVLFYLLIFIHPANPGYALFFLPALLILMAQSTRHISFDLKLDSTRLLTTVIVIINTGIFFLSNYPVSYREIKTHDRDLSIMLSALKTYDPLNTAVFVGPYIFYGYRQIMYYLPEYKVYQVDHRIAPTGQERKIFWGTNRQTFLTDKIFLPRHVDHFIIPWIYKTNELNRKGGIKIDRLQSTDIYLVSGSISHIKNIFPELTIHIQPA
jgi:hypothetical protein